MTTLIYIYIASLAIPAIIALWIFNKVSADYRPIFIYLILTCILDTLQLFFIRDGWWLDLVQKLQYLLEAVLICWQAKNWGVLYRRQWFFVVIIVSLLALWLAEKFL